MAIILHQIKDFCNLNLIILTISIFLKFWNWLISVRLKKNKEFYVLIFLTFDGNKVNPHKYY